MPRAASGPHQKKVPKFTLLLCRFSVYLIELCISLLVLDVALLALKITPQGQKIIYRRAQSRSAIVGPIEVQKKSARPQTKEPTTDNRLQHREISSTHSTREPPVGGYAKECPLGAPLVPRSPGPCRRASPPAGASRCRWAPLRFNRPWPILGPTKKKCGLWEGKIKAGKFGKIVVKINPFLKIKKSAKNHTV